MLTETIVAGRLFCPTVRSLLEQAKFLGYAIEWHESRGLFQRVFTVKGPIEDVRKVLSAMVTALS